MKDCPACNTPVDGLVCHACGFDPERKKVDRSAIHPRVAQAMKDTWSRPAPDPRDWARKILKKAKTGDYTYLYGIECAREALGLSPVDSNAP